MYWAWVYQGWVQKSGYHNTFRFSMTFVEHQFQILSCSNSSKFSSCAFLFVSPTKRTIIGLKRANHDPSLATHHFHPAQP